MKKTILIFAICLVGVGCIIPSFQEAKAAIAADERNQGIEVRFRSKNLITSDILVFDLQTVPEDKAPVDMFRVLLQSAEALKDKDFTHVELAYRGVSKFILDGPYFKTLGEEYEAQNPIYTMRTLPENLLTMDGEAAYSTWTGGILAVMEKQMEDFSDFHTKWYLEDMAKAVQ